jgi:hypothetical protein
MKKRQLYTDPGILGKANPSRGVLCTAGSPRQWKRVCQGEARKAPKKKTHVGFLFHEQEEKSFKRSG